jgi:hypothetical protein
MPVKTRSMTKLKSDDYMSNIECNKEELRKIIYKLNGTTSTIESVCMYPIYLVGISLVFSGIYYLNLIVS